MECHVRRHGTSAEPSGDKPQALQPPADFPFPYTPYDIQRDFMRNLYEVLENGGLGIFESPTGTVCPCKYIHISVRTKPSPNASREHNTHIGNCRANRKASSAAPWRGLRTMKSAACSLLRPLCPRTKVCVAPPHPTPCSAIAGVVHRRTCAHAPCCLVPQAIRTGGSTTSSTSRPRASRRSGQGPSARFALWRPASYRNVGSTCKLIQLPSQARLAAEQRVAAVGQALFAKKKKIASVCRGRAWLLCEAVCNVAAVPMQVQPRGDDPVDIPGTFGSRRACRRGQWGGALSSACCAGTAGSQARHVFDDDLVLDGSSDTEKAKDIWDVRCAAPRQRNECVLLIA
jgi:hypothetical protein